MGGGGGAAGPLPVRNGSQWPDWAQQAARRLMELHVVQIPGPTRRVIKARWVPTGDHWSRRLASLVQLIVRGPIGLTGDQRATGPTDLTKYAANCDGSQGDTWSQGIQGDAVTTDYIGPTGSLATRTGPTGPTGSYGSSRSQWI